MRSVYRILLESLGVSVSFFFFCFVSENQRIKRNTPITFPRIWKT